MKNRFLRTVQLLCLIPVILFMFRVIETPVEYKIYTFTILIILASICQKAIDSDK